MPKSGSGVPPLNGVPKSGSGVPPLFRAEPRRLCHFTNNFGMHPPRVRCIHKLSVAVETEERASVKPAHKLLAGLISILRLHLTSNVGGRH